MPGEISSTVRIGTASLHVVQLLYLAVAGCTSTKQPDWSTIVSCSRLDRRENGLVYEKGVDRLFSGATVEYDNRAGFRIVRYHNGEKEEGSPLHLPRVISFVSRGKAWDDALYDTVRRSGPSHGAYAYFIGHGRDRDIPILLYALSTYEVGSGGRILCEHLHCLEALRSITEADPGITYDDWIRWYRENYGADPPAWRPREE